MILRVFSLIYEGRQWATQKAAPDIDSHEASGDYINHALEIS